MDIIIIFKNLLQILMGINKSTPYILFILFFLWIMESRHCVDINVAFMAPSSSPNGYNASSSFPALAYALDKIEEQGILSDGYNLVVTWYDTECDSKTAAGTAVELYINDTVDVFIGPPCPDAAKGVADLAAYWNKPIVNWVPLTFELSNKLKYNTLIGSFGDIYTSYGPAVRVLFNFAGWNLCATVHISNDYEESIQVSIARVFSESGVEISSEFEVRQDASNGEIRDIFRAIKDQARIVILIIPAEEIRKYMLVAHDLNMVDGDYSFIWLDDFVSEEFLFGDKPWAGDDNKNQEARKAFEALIHITVANDVAFDEDMYKSWKSEALDIATSSPYTDIIADATESDLYSPFLVYGMYMYAHALNLTIQNGGDYTDGTEIKSAIELKSFESPMAEYQVRTADVVVNSRSDRTTGLWLLNQRGDGCFEIIGDVVSYLSGDEILMNSTRILPVRWANGKKGFENAPPDTPRCGFDGSKCIKETNWLVIFLPFSLLLVAMTAAVVIVVYVLREKKLKREISRLLWEIKYKDINFNVKTIGSQTKLSRRDHSLISADVINRSKTSVGENSLQSIEEQCPERRTTQIGVYKGQVVAVRFLRKEDILVTDALIDDLGNIKKIAHNNLNVFAGACIERFCICALWRYCSKGSLQDILEDENIKLDSYFKISMLSDIVSGMVYLHDSAIGSHGRLKSTNIVVDSRWVCKITDYGITSLYEGEGDDPDSSADARAQGLYWTAPELLRKDTTDRHGTQGGDLYSFAIIAKEILCRNKPYAEFEDLKPTEIIKKVRSPETNHRMIFRPSLANIEKIENRKTFIKLTHLCWHENPDERPTFLQLMKEFQHAHKRGRSVNVVDNMINMLERYANNLEEIVNERTVQLQAEKKRSDTLLLRMLPRSVASELKEGRSVEPEWFDEVTIYFSDVVGFTSLAKESTPLQVVVFLNALYNAFDTIIKKYDVYKVETIGDAYMIVSGLPNRNGHKHAVEIATCSLELLKVARTFKIPHQPNVPLQIRIGCHTGPCAAGVVGNAMPRYCLFGDTVNTASRMESNGEPMKIHISENCKHALDPFKAFVCPPRGPIDVKGKGIMFTYWVSGTREVVKTEAITQPEPEDNGDSGLTPVVGISSNVTLVRPQNPWKEGN